MAHWADEYDQPSELFIKPIENYLTGDKDLIDTFWMGYENSFRTDSNI